MPTYAVGHAFAEQLWSFDWPLRRPKKPSAWELQLFELERALPYTPLVWRHILVEVSIIFCSFRPSRPFLLPSLLPLDFRWTPRKKTRMSCGEPGIVFFFAALIGSTPSAQTARKVGFVSIESGVAQATAKEPRPGNSFQRRGSFVNLFPLLALCISLEVIASRLEGLLAITLSPLSLQRVLHVFVSSFPQSAQMRKMDSRFM